MKNNEQYEPQAEHKFSFGLWTLGNRGRDPFGDFVRPVISPIEIVRTLGEVGAWGVNLHDNDLVPRRHSSGERRDRARVRKGLRRQRTGRSDGHRFAVLSPRFS